MQRKNVKYSYYINPLATYNKLKRYYISAETYDCGNCFWRNSHFFTPEKYFIPVSEKWVLLHYPEAI